MGVLVEAISVIVPATALAERYPGGRQAYESEAPNRTFCTDGHLTRLGFMTPSDVQAFVERLTDRGLNFHDGREFVDIAIVDQFRGPTSSCPWLECGRHPAGFSVAWMRGTNPSPMAAPAGWSIEQSEKLTFVPNETSAVRLLPLLRDGMVDVLLDYATGKEVYIGRTTKETDIG